MVVGIITFVQRGTAHARLQVNNKKKGKRNFENAPSHNRTLVRELDAVNCSVFRVVNGDSEWFKF